MAETRGHQQFEEIVNSVGGSPRVAVVGIGEDGADGLAPHARALVEAAEVLAGGVRHLAFFSHHRARRIVLQDDLNSALRRIRAVANRRRVVVLASGDPLFFGIGMRLAEALGRERLEFLPQPSAMQVGFARLGVPWQDALLLSAHGRDLEPVLARALSARTIAILTDERNTPAVIAAGLLDAGVEPCAAYVLERLGGPRERIVAARLDELPGREFDPLNVMVLLRERPSRRPVLGLPDDAYAHRDGMITHAEVRTVALSRMGLFSGAVAWDVGAGCGSLAIEAAALAAPGRVCAVERDAAQRELLRQNRARHLAWNLEVVAGEAPAELRRLPAPDAVFVGGSGGRLREVLRTALRRLVPGGRLVLNAVLLETVEQARRVCRAEGWEVDLCQISVSRAQPAGEGTRLSALNPVFIMSARRGGER